jgi:oligopeptide/dipeptide ABC transporter ATP-binding protein
MAVMMLKERGLLSYDDIIARFFPNFPDYKDRVTIRHLMTHTSGIKEYFDDDFIKLAHEMGDSLTQEDIFERIKNFGGLEFEPNTRFSYCNSSYVIAWGNCRESITKILCRGTSIATGQLELIKELRDSFGTSILIITHDFGIVSEIADRVAVMYAGKIVEIGDVTQIYENPCHPYPKLLMRALPRITKKEGRLETIPGSVPNLVAPPMGCRFRKYIIILFIHIPSAFYLRLPLFRQGIETGES